MPETMNILQVDVEDWYMDLDIGEWGKYEDRVVASTARVLDILKESDVHATFFVLGYLAERHPDIVQRIVEDGHEVGSHGYCHKPITAMTPDFFEEDLVKSIDAISDVTGEKVIGYRAPFFTITEKTSWAIDIMKKTGLAYDSSIFPVRTHLYGIPDAQTGLYRPSSCDIKEDDPEEKFFEIPLSVLKPPVINFNIPVAGGFYLRLFPYSFTSFAIKRINRFDRPAVCYLHPWELDMGQPRLGSLGWYHYHNLRSMEAKLMRLVKDFKFTSTADWLEHTGTYCKTGIGTTGPCCSHRASLEYWL